MGVYVRMGDAVRFLGGGLICIMGDECWKEPHTAML